MNAVLDLKDVVSAELSPLEIINDYVGNLTEQAGSEKDKYLSVSFHDLFNLSAALNTCLNNLKRVIS